jgi:cytochrome oxidase assembly protein ShyY1
MNIKRKVLYSVLTLPIAGMTFKAFLWQKRRKLDKIEEMDLRFKRLEGEPFRVEEVDKLPWVGVDSELFKQEWEFRPILVKGHFERKKCVYIQRTKESEPGYHLVCPLVYSNGMILVDRGWVPLDWEQVKENFEENTNNLNATDTIVGVLYKGDRLNKYSEDKIDKSSNKLLTMDPKTIAEVLNLLDKDTSGTCVFKQQSQSDKDPF